MREKDSCRELLLLRSSEHREALGIRRVEKHLKEAALKLNEARQRGAHRQAREWLHYGDANGMGT